jgi:hypothetical protein
VVEQGLQGQLEISALEQAGLVPQIHQQINVTIGAWSRAMEPNKIRLLAP